MVDIVTTTLSSLIVFTGLLDALGVSTVSLSTNYGFFSTISAGTIYAKFVGDGSGFINTSSLSTFILLANYGYISNANNTFLSAGAGTFSSLTVGTLFATTIRS